MSLPDLGSASDWSCCTGIRSTTPIWTSVSNFCARFSDVILQETRGGVTKCRLYCYLRLHCCHFHKNPDLCQMEHVPHTWRTLQSKFPDFFGKWLSVEQEGQKFRLVWKDYINLKHAPQHIARVVGTFLLYHFHWLCKSILYKIFIIIQAYLLSKLFK